MFACNELASDAGARLLRPRKTPKESTKRTLAPEDAIDLHIKSSERACGLLL